MSSDGGSSSIPLGGIIGLSVAGGAVVIVTIIIIYVICTRVRKRKKEGVPKEEVIYAEVGNVHDSPPPESSQYAKVEFKKSDKFKKQKKKAGKSGASSAGTVNAGPVYAEIRRTPSSPAPLADSPEPRYANINIQSSV